MRLIDADKLLEETRRDRDYARKNGFLDMYYERQVLIDRIEAQPTAYDVDKGAEMSEWLTDKEKRILFAALTREKEVCIEVDKQCEPREPYEQSLQSVCESLEHKFYYDRLFKKMEKQIRAEAIDDFVKALQKKIEKALASPDLALECKKCGIWKIYDVKEIAEQLKEMESD